MPYTHLHLKDFRSYADHELQFGPGVTVVVGPNGSGKTNILEALYVISTGNSFRSADRDLIRHGAGWFRIEARYDDAMRVLTYDSTQELAPKQFSLDQVHKSRLSYQQKIPVVLFEPDHLRLLGGPPAPRRDYLDGVLARLQPDFSRTRSQFERALLQRNSVLKRTQRPSAFLQDQLFVWNIKLAELAERIVERRLGLLAFFNQHIDTLYTHIADTSTNVQLDYVSDLRTEQYKQSMLARLTSQLDRDLLRGFTGVGPHRDDFSISLNGKAAATSASRGEVRSLLLALKLIELKLLEQQHVHSPLLLLDDVFSELDAIRRRTLSTLARPYQTIITTTDADVVKDYFDDHVTLLRTV